MLKGAPVAQAIREEAAREAAALKARRVEPCLAFLHPAGDGAAASYAESQRKSCEKAGVGHRTLVLPAGASQADLLAAVDRLKQDRAVTGILVSSPLPKPLDGFAAVLRAGPELDVEGMHPENYGRLAERAPTVVPPTAEAAFRLLKAAGVPFAGRHAVVVGRSLPVGNALVQLLLAERPGPTVTVCHTGTADLAAVTRTADLIVVAAGRPGTLRGGMVKDGAVVVDVGTNVVKDAAGAERLVGDVAYDEVAPSCAAISPVPGGVGPVTSACLLRNVVRAAARLYPD